MNASGSPGTDSTVKRLDLSDAFIHHPEATFIVREQVTDVGMVQGIGKRTTEKLEIGGIRSVRHVLRAGVTTLRRQFSAVLEKTVRELHGTACMELDDAPAPGQQIRVQRLPGTTGTQVDGILEAVSAFASRAAQRLRQQGSVAGAVGRDSLRLGSTAVASIGAEIAVWSTKQERRTPRYTTRRDEMLQVRARVSERAGPPRGVRPSS